MSWPVVTLVNPKHAHNVAAAIRACSCFGVETLYWTGRRVNPSGYDKLPREERMKGYRDVEWLNTDRPLDLYPDAQPVCVELHPGSESLYEFEHPGKAIYVFGPEDGGVPWQFRRLCHRFVHIPSRHCLNLSAALNVVLFDRQRKLGIEPSIVETENRGQISVPGWDGK